MCIVAERERGGCASTHIHRPQVPEMKSSGYKIIDDKQFLESRFQFDCKQVDR